MIDIFTLTNDLQAWLEEIVVILGAVLTVTGFVIGKFKRAKDQLVKLLDKSETPNHDLLRLAELENLKSAGREIKKLFQK